MVAIQSGSGGAVNTVHQDPVTKSQRITDSSGTLTSTIVDLDPWGGETGRSSNQAFQPHRYTSYERDANGGDDAMMRRYQSSSSRFNQPDPYDGSYNLTDPQSLNRYAYTQNDPVNFVDPSGLNMSGHGFCYLVQVGYDPIYGEFPVYEQRCVFWGSGGGGPIGGGIGPGDPGVGGESVENPPPDPCEGKKGNLNYFAWNQKSDGSPGYGDGTYRANEHIFNRHVDPTQHLGASKYAVGKDPAMDAGAQMWAVNMTNHATFHRATGVQATNGKSSMCTPSRAIMRRRSTHMSVLIQALMGKEQMSIQW